MSHVPVEVVRNTRSAVENNRYKSFLLDLV